MMPAPSRRPFGLWDTIVLVAGTAVGFAALRFAVEVMGLPWKAIRKSDIVRSHIEQIVRSDLTPWLAYASIILAGWTLAALVLSLSRPRPTIRRLARRPGFLASVAATVGLIAHGAASQAPLTMNLSADLAAYIIMVLAFMPTYAGSMVAGAWLAAALGGRWRPESTWLDRFGIALGVAWIGLVVLGWLRGLLR